MSVDKEKAGLSGRAKVALHAGVVALFGVIAYLISIFATPYGGGERIVITLVFWFGLTYLYAMLFVSAWARKRFEQGRGEVQDSKADFGL